MSGIRAQVLKLRLSLFDFGLFLVSMLPVFTLLVWQSQYRGYATTLGSQVASNDSAGWQACAGALAEGSISANIDWCFRRPVAVLLQVPLYWISPNSGATWLLLQTLLISSVAWIALLAAMRVLGAPRAFAGVAAFGLWWPNVQYGSNFGPEGVALLLAYLSVIALLFFLDTRRILWGVASGGAAILSLAARPGNLILTVVVSAFVVWMSWRISKKALPALIAGVILFATWYLPNRALHLIGFENAGHSSNFWATVYSAATPAADNWNVAYQDFVAEAQTFGTESNEFGEALRGGALNLIQIDPTAFVQQLLTNASNLIDSGLMTRAWGIPAAPNVSPTLLTNLLHLGQPSQVGTSAATLTWVLSLAVFSGLVWVSLQSLRILRSSPTKADSNMRTGAQTRLALACIGLVAYGGSLAFYALVGHDEGTRHLVQNIPFLALSFMVVGAQMAVRGAGSRKTNYGSAIRTRPVVTAVCAGLVLCLLAVVLVESRQSTARIVALPDCLGGMPRQNPVTFDVIASVPYGTSLPFPLAQSGWRTLDDAGLSFVMPTSNYYTQFLPEVDSGYFLSIRNVQTSDLIQAFLSERDFHDWNERGGELGLCFRSISATDAAANLAIGAILDSVDR